jgi:transcription elongation GreA/GreB family factor
MDKKKVIEQIQIYLAGELNTLLEASKAAHEAATHEESRPEDQYDTRGLEASYLAGAQAQRAAELKQLLIMYKFLPVRPFDSSDVIVPTALVEMEYNRTRAFYFVAPSGGGLITRIEGHAVQVITPQSPIGEALMGKKVGDVVEVEMRGGVREYRVISLA